MKKIISLFLALLMAFSVVTVAFATDAESTVPETTVAADDENGETTEEEATDFGDLQWILDLPFWTVKPALKFAKIAFKLVSVYLKVGKIFGLVEKDMGDMILEAVLGLIENSTSGEGAEDTTVAEDTTAAEVAA